MAMRFLIRTADDDGYQYRIEIDRDGYSGPVTELTPGAPTFDIALGRNSPDVLWRPIEESSVQIRAVDDDADLDEIFDSGRREYSVNITRRLQDTSDAFVSVWRGFLRPDFYQDDPHNRSLVTLEAVDGLALLKQEQADIRLLPESYQAAVRRLLAEVGYELPARFAIPYYPSTIASSSNVEKLDVRWEGLRDLTKYEALRSLMAAFGAQLKQSKGEWRIDTRTSLAREDAWRRYDTADVVTTGSLPDDVKPFTFNLDTFGQPVNTFRPATAAVQVTHDHERIPNLLLNPGFENGSSATDIDAWALTQPDDGGSLVDRVSWDATTVKDATQENEWVLRARRRAGGTPHYDGPILEQETMTQVQRGRGEILMQFIDGRADFTTPQRFRVRLETEDGFFLRTGTAQVLDSFLGSDGESGQLSIEAVDGAAGAIVAPAGARLPIRSGGSLEAHDATITLSEPWRVGDTTLIGEVSDSIDVDSVGPVDVLYYQWETTSGAVPGWEWPVAFGFTVGTSDREEDAEVRLRRQKWTLPTATVNGVGIGGRLTLTLEMVTASTTSLPRESFFDDFRIQPLLDGREIESTSIVASTSSADGAASLSTLIADAPFSRSLRGFRVDDSAIVASLPGGGGDQVIYDSEDNVTRNWRLGPGGTSSGLSLIEIVGRETLRTERRTLPVIQRALSTQPDKAGDIWPGTVLQDTAGQQYTIGRYQRVFGARGAHVTCEGALLADYGTSSISYALTQESGQSRQTGTGGGTTIVGGGGGGGGGDFVDWGNVTGKPPLVNSFNTRDGDVTLTGADVTGALGFTPPPETRQINTTDGLAGGGTLELDRTLGLTGESLGWHQFLEGLPGGDGFIRRQGGGFAIEEIDTNSFADADDLVTGVSLTEDTLQGETNLGTLQVTLERSGAVNFQAGVNLDHTHDAGDISGTLALAQIPTLGTGKVDFADQQLNTNSSPTFGGLDVNGNLDVRGSEYDAQFRTRVSSQPNVVIGYRNTASGTSSYYAGFDVDTGDFGFVEGITAISESTSNILLNTNGNAIFGGDLDVGGDVDVNGTIRSGDIEIGSSLRANASAARFEVDSGAQTSVVMGFLGGIPKNDGSGNWGSNDRGFWVRAGDNLVIDGDVEYADGDWLIENDASLRIQDGITGDDIIRLGTDAGDKGLFLYSGTSPNNKLVSLTQSGLTAENFRLEAGSDFWDSDGSFRFGGTSGITKGTSGGITLGSNTTIEGTLSGADGTFSGSLQAATGSFAGDISAATGTFSGDLSAAGGTFSGDLQAVGGTFSGQLQAASGSFSGDLDAVEGTLGELAIGDSITIQESGEILSESGAFRLTDEGLQIDTRNDDEQGSGRRRIGFFEDLSDVQPVVRIEANNAIGDPGGELFIGTTSPWEIRLNQAGQDFTMRDGEINIGRPLTVDGDDILLGDGTSVCRVTSGRDGDTANLINTFDIFAKNITFEVSQGAVEMNDLFLTKDEGESGTGEALRVGAVISASASNPNPQNGAVGTVRFANNAIWIKSGPTRWHKVLVDDIV